MKIVCLGDSITYGQNVRADRAWPAVLGLMTGDDVRNEGRCGDTTRLALERWHNSVALQQPDVVVIQFGHNDANVWQTDAGRPRVSARAFEANINEMILRAVAINATPLVLKPYTDVDRPAQYIALLARYAGLIRGIDPPAVSLLDDGYGLHPDEPMHDRFARRVAEHLP